MTFDQLVLRLQSLYDVDQGRAVDVANERLARMVAEAKSLRGLKVLGTTVAGLGTYALDPTVVQVYRVRVIYTNGSATYEGTESFEALWDLEDGRATGDGNWYAIAPDTDSSQTTDNLALYPAPTVTGATISALCALTPATATYGTSAALPIPLDLHEHLLAGCKAELSDEDSRQDESAKFESVFQIGVQKLRARSMSRASGSDRHRLRMVGYDLGR